MTSLALPRATMPGNRYLKRGFFTKSKLGPMAAASCTSEILSDNTDVHSLNGRRSGRRRAACSCRLPTGLGLIQCRRFIPIHYVRCGVKLLLESTMVRLPPVAEVAFRARRPALGASVGRKVMGWPLEQGA